MAAETLNPTAIAMIVVGAVLLYVFGLGWGIYRAWRKGRERSSSGSGEK